MAHLTDDNPDRYKTYQRGGGQIVPLSKTEGITTKRLLEITGISEATLRRWLKEGQPVPELADCRRDWRGWRIWEERHVAAILSYQEEKRKQHESRELGSQHCSRGQGERSKL